MDNKTALQNSIIFYYKQKKKKKYFPVIKNMQKKKGMQNYWDARLKFTQWKEKKTLRRRVRTWYLQFTQIYNRISIRISASGQRKILFARAGVKFSLLTLIIGSL